MLYVHVVLISPEATHTETCTHVTQRHFGTKHLHLYVHDMYMRYCGDVI